MKHTTNEVLEFLRSQKNFFEREFKVKKLGIFGSYASGNPSSQSDIDVVVELEKPDLLYLIGIKQTIEDALNSKVDIVRLRENMNKALKSRIERNAIYV